MDLKDILNSLTQLSEATQETSKGRVHKAGPGGYGRKFDTDEEGDEKAEKKPEEKRGRGRPKKQSDEKSYDTDALGKAFGIGKPPKKPIGAPSKKHTLKDWIEYVEENVHLNEAEQVTIQPAQQNTQVIKQGDKTLGTVTNPQLAAQIKQSIGKGEMTLSGDELEEGVLDSMADFFRVNKTITPDRLRKMYSTVDNAGGAYSSNPNVPMSAKFLWNAVGAIANKQGIQRPTNPDDQMLNAAWNLVKSSKSDPFAYDKSGLSKTMQKIGQTAIAKKGTHYESIEESTNGDGALRLQGQNMNHPMNEKALSKAQQKFMGMVHAAQKGEKPASKAVADVAKTMSKKAAKDFAATKHKGLPEKVKSEKTEEGTNPAIGKDVISPKERLAPHAGMGKGKIQQKLGQAGTVVKNIGRFLKGKPEIPTMEGVEVKDQSLLNEGAMSDLVTRFIEDLTTSKVRGFNINNAVELQDLAAAKRVINNTLEHGDRYKRLAGTLKGQLRDYALEEFGFTNYDESLEECDTKPEPQQSMNAVRLAKTDKAEISPFRSGAPELSLEDTMKDIQFESWEKQLNTLLVEGLTVSSSTGQQGSPDSVTISATDSDATELLSIVRKAGLGVFGSETPEEQTGDSSLMSVQSDHADGSGTEPEASPKVVGDGDDMLALIKKMSGSSTQSSVSEAEDEEVEESYQDDEEVEESYHNDMEEGNAFTGKLAATKKGEEFELDGKKYKDTSNLEEEALDQPATMEEKMCEVHDMNESECGCSKVDENFANDAGGDAMAATELAKLKALLSLGNDLHKMKKDQTVMNPTQVSVKESIADWMKLSGIK